MLTVEGLQKSYGGVQALRHLSFTATPGRVIGLLGPNGSGKSTTINLLTGLMRPSAGTVCWNGVDIQRQLVSYQARLGYVPEEPRLYAYLNAVEYLALVGGLRDIDSAVVARRIDRFLELFDLDSDRYAPLSAFSKGMRQKVLISAALLHDPEVVVFDEPCSGLDVASTLMLRSVVRTLAEAGKTIVYSSHVLDTVEKICTDVIILHHGTVVAQDSVARLRALSRDASLEAVFAKLAVDENVDATGRAIAAVGTW